MKGEHSVAAWRLQRVIARCQTAEQKLRHPHCCVDSQRSSLLMSDLPWLDVTKYIWQENPKSHYKIKQGLFWQPYVLFKVFMPLLKLPLNSARTRPHTHIISYYSYLDVFILIGHMERCLLLSPSDKIIGSLVKKFADAKVHCCLSYHFFFPKYIFFNVCVYKLRHRAVIRLLQCY